MKSPANAKEEREKTYNTINHGEANWKRHSLWFIIFIGLIFLPGATEALPSETHFTHGEVKRTSLDNGITVLLKEDHKLPLVSLLLCVRVGSAEEGKFNGAGISHFTEHMVFKGSLTREAGEVFKEIESCGGKINAFTSYDYTGYKITVPAEFVFQALEVLADIVMNATFNEQELEKERAVVLKELRLNYDNPKRHAARLLWQTAYLIHPYKYPILGEEENFKKLTRKDLLEFYHRNYRPNNMVLAIVGDVEAEKTLSYTKDIFKDFAPGPIQARQSQPEPKQKELRKHQAKFTAGLTYLVLGFHSVAITDEDLFALDVLAAVLGQGESSRLYQLICAKKRLAFSLQAVNYTPRQPGLFLISCCLEERHRKRVLSLLLKQTKVTKKKKISETELDSAKSKIISDILFDNQTQQAQAADLALNEAIAGDFRFTEKYIQGISEVKSEDILKVANKYLNQDNLSIVALTPQDKGTKSNIPRNSGEHFTIGIEGLSREEGVKRYLLDNGLRLLIKENRDLPLISIKAVFKGGLRTEDDDINGLCNLTAKMLDKGTKTKTAAEIAYLVESKGARLSCFSGNNSFGLSLDLLSEDFDRMLALLAELITDSTFPQREFNRQKEKNLAQLKTEQDDIFESGKKLLKKTLFRKHPMRLSTVGSELSLKKLRQRDVKKFYQNFCVGKNMVLAIFGNVDAQQVLVKVKRLFARLSAQDAPLIITPGEPTAQQIKRAHQPLNKKQSLVMLGFQRTGVLSPDRYVLEIICQLLAQSSGRLFTHIREEIGLAYALGAYSVLGLDCGYLVIYVATTAENVEEVKKEIMHQLQLLQQKPLSEEELAQVKRAILSRRLIGRQTNSACALESALDELYGLGYNHYLEYDAEIKRIQASDITRCAKQYFNLNNYAVVVVGPIAEVESVEN